MAFLNPYQLLNAGAAPEPAAQVVPVPTQAAIDISNRAAQPPKKVVVKNPKAPAKNKPAAAPTVAMPGTPFGGAAAEVLQAEQAVPVGSIRDIRKGTVDQNQQARDVRTENLYMDPDTLRQLSDAITNLPEMQGQKQQMALDRKFAGDVAMAHQPQLDVTPLMSLTDAWTGSHFAKDYHAPNNDMGAKLLLDFGAKQAKELEDRNKLILTAAQNMKSGTAQQQQTEALKKTLTAGTNPYKPPGGSQNQPLNDATKYQRAFQGMQTFKDAQGLISSANEVKAALANPNWLTDSMVQANILKAMKLFPVSDRDAKQVTGSGDIANKVDQLVNKYERGEKFTEADRNTIATFASVQLKRAKMHMDKAQNEFVNGMPPPTGYTRETARGILAPTIPGIDDNGPQVNKQELIDMWKEFNASKGKK